MTVENPYDAFTDVFRKIVDKHAPMKTKKVRGTQAPFVTKELRKAIMTRSRLKNKYNKWKSREFFLAFRQSKKECKRLTILSKSNHIKNATKNGIMTSKDFWKFMKPIMVNKGIIASNTIILEENGELVSNEEHIVEIFNNHYINIVENTVGKPPQSLGNPSMPENDRNTVRKILDTYKNHPIIQNNLKASDLSFTLPLALKSEINHIAKNIDISKSTGNDSIPPKIVKMAADIIDEPLTKNFNHSIANNKFCESAKTANVAPIYKKEDRTMKINYRPVSILNVFSKMFEKYVKQKIEPFVDKMQSSLISAYRKHYSSNHVLISLLEKWKKI